MEPFLQIDCLHMAINEEVETKMSHNNLVYSQSIYMLFPYTPYLILLWHHSFTSQKIYMSLLLLAFPSAFQPLSHRNGSTTGIFQEFSQDLHWHSLLYTLYPKFLCSRTTVLFPVLENLGKIQSFSAIYTSQNNIPDHYSHLLNHPLYSSKLVSFIFFLPPYLCTFDAILFIFFSKCNIMSLYMCLY